MLRPGESALLNVTDVARIKWDIGFFRKKRYNKIVLVVQE